jgi:glycosyltransferase involved in cell wall biosynthesis
MDTKQSTFLYSPQNSSFNMNSRITIVIPAYNEEKRIGPVLEEVSHFIFTNGLPWEVIVSIDGNDSTEDIVNMYNEQFQFVHSMKSVNRSGMGGGIKRGMRASVGDYIILMDGDGSSSLHDMIPHLELLNKYDIINFDRYSDPNNKIPLKRRFASRSFNLMLRMIFGIHIFDTQCGYKIINRSALELILNKITVTNAFFLSALFLYAKQQGLRVAEAPIKYNHSAGSKFNVVMTSISYIISISAFKIRNSSFYDYVPKFMKDLYYKKLRWI